VSVFALRSLTGDVPDFGSSGLSAAISEHVCECSCLEEFYTCF
jgi:hypothetical protein